MKLLESLKHLGFTQHEALLYLSLCRYGALSGYEAAKQSGISRSNAYSALSSLVDKGGAYIIEGKRTTYMATPKNELITNLSREFNEHIDYLSLHLNDSPIVNNPYITISGQNNIINKVKNMIASSQHRIYFSGSEHTLNLFKEDLELASTRGLKVVIIAPKNPSIPDAIFYKSHPLDSLKIIIDTEEIISGKLSLDDDCQCLYTKNITLVQIIREAFINEIELIKRP